ncbi:LysR family transcriptional regulator [Bradyrhizobium sp. BR 10289]|nr:LysR family transcriptional regulator [Bradyrhizobium sp. BR 10289]
MELRHLRHFVAVAEEGHITRAAERLGMQQPPLSQRIKAIEAELDVQLFRRKARGVELTEAGQVFLDRARATLAQYDGAFEATRSAARGEQGRLCVGIVPTTPFHPFVPSIIRAFRTAYPLVSLTLDECLGQEALQRLSDGQMDVAFLRAPVESQKLVVNPLLVEPMVVALPSDHALARGDRGRGALALKDLADQTFIIYARQLGPAFYEATMTACMKAGFTPRLGQEAPRIISALSLVAVGLGISLVPACMQRMTMDGVAYRPIKGGGQPKAVLNLASRRGEPSPVVRNFVGLVRRAARNFPSGS